MKTKQEAIKKIKDFMETSDGRRNFCKVILDYNSIEFDEDSVSVEYETTDEEETGRINLELHEDDRLYLKDVDIF